MREAAGEADLLGSAQRQGSDAGYTRHVVHGDPFGRFTILSLVWRQGQSSPVHWHHTWCAYVVLSGTLSEEAYAWSEADGRATFSGRRERRAGDVAHSTAGSGRIHRLGNGLAQDAVSVHVYGVRDDQIGTGVNRVVDRYQVP